VTYSGLERLPILRLLATQVSVQHGYSSTSESRYATLFDPEARLIDFSFGDQSTVLAGVASQDSTGYDEPTSITVNERFQPLLGLTLGIKGGIQASISTNRTSQYSLQASTANVIEKTSQDVRVDLSYSRQGMRLFGLRGINNNIRFQLTALVAGDETFRHPLQNDILADLLPEDDLRRDQELPQRTSRISLSPQISYTVSNQVTADLVAQYDRTFSEAAGLTNRFTSAVRLRILFSN
ncbi:MAG: hypothetical protein AAGK21_15620, partial [Bacteroidota bacterium]